MKKDKVYELKIEEEDELSGVDQISLVDDPAIMINWLAFNKIKPEYFHIPDGEDNIYLDRLLNKAENEQDLLDEGWVVDSVKIVDKDNFASIQVPTPNAASEQDEKKYRIRYKYILNPAAGTEPIIPTTREFCRELIRKNYVWRIEDMVATTNDTNTEYGSNQAWLWRGGFNCRHVWAEIKYRYDERIINKASVNTAKVLVDGMPNDLIPDIPRQPNTVVSSHPSFSAVKFQSEMDIFGYKTKYFYICPGAQATFKELVQVQGPDVEGMIRSAAVVADSVFRLEADVIKKGASTVSEINEAEKLVEDFRDIIGEIEKISGKKYDVSYMDGHIDKIASYSKLTSESLESISDYPDSVKNNAKRGIKLNEENGNKCATQVGKIRAQQLANGEPISMETVKRMYSYLSRAETYYDDADENTDCGYISFLLWGGKTALSWAESKMKSFGYDVSTIGGYEDPGIKKKKKEKKFQIESEDKRIIVGPAMVPDLRIPRVSPNGENYTVFFSADTIKMIAEKYMRNKYLDNNDEMHNGEAVKDVYVIESWIKESEEDKSNKYGFQDTPIGTWFVMMRVKNDDVWKKIKEGQLRGFSVSGWFEEIAAFCREEMFLQRLAQLLEKY